MFKNIEDRELQYISTIYNVFNLVVKTNEGDITDSPFCFILLDRLQASADTKTCNALFKFVLHPFARSYCC